MTMGQGYLNTLSEVAAEERWTFCPSAFELKQKERFTQIRNRNEDWVGKLSLSDQK